MRESWWTLREAATRFGRSERDLRTAIQSGDLVGIPAPNGEDWLIRESDLLLLPSEPTLPRPRSVPSREVPFLFILLLIAVIAFFVMVNISGSTSCGGPAHVTEVVLKEVGGQLEMFMLNHDRYADRLADLVKMPAYVDPDSWPKGGYLTDQPLDGWGQELVYKVPGTNGRTFDLFSVGTDARGSKDPSTYLWYHGTQNQNLEEEGDDRGPTFAFP